MLDVFTRIVLAGAFVFTFAWVILAQRRTIKLLSDAYLRLTHFQRVLVALAVIVCTVYAQKPSTNEVNGGTGTDDVEIAIGGDTNDFEIVEGGTNDVDVVEGGDTNGVENGSGEAESFPLLMERTPSPQSGGESASPFSVTDEDAVRGYCLESVSTNEDYSYTMPADGAIRGTWHLTGAYEDVQKIGLEGSGGWGGSAFEFPIGSQLCTSLWAYTWGKVRPQLKNASNEIAAVGAPMSAVPYRSRLWTAETTNAFLVTWENFVLGRVSSADYQLPSTNYQLVSAQIELRASGDFITRSNDVEMVYRRVDPEDWDDDGWRNDDDPDPYAWEEYWDSFWQELPDGANESAYCWIEIRPRWHSYIEFAGDGPSNLDDPYLWAKAGETYRVQLLIGKTYAIESTQPIDVVGRSDSSIEIDGDGTCELEVVWPVRFPRLKGTAMVSGWSCGLRDSADVFSGRIRAARFMARIWFSGMAVRGIAVARGVMPMGTTNTKVTGLRRPADGADVHRTTTERILTNSRQSGSRCRSPIGRSFSRTRTRTQRTISSPGIPRRLN